LSPYTTLFRSGVRIQGCEGTLDYGLVEQSARLGRVEQRIGLAATAGLTEQGDVARITTKGGDIVLHPFQRHHQVHLAIVAGTAVAALRTQQRVREVAERAETVVDGHQYHAAVGQPFGVVVLARVGREDGEGATMEP